MAALLEIRELEVGFPGAGGRLLRVVRGASLAIAKGEITALVGESGSGKSLTALAVLGLVPAPGRILAGRVLLAGRDLVGLPERALRAVRGGRIGYVFQEPASALNPVLTVGAQLSETLRSHLPLSRSAARARAVDLLERLALPDPGRRLRDYPHQLSGGQLQRVALALALAGEPELLIADEPTTALDVTVQAEILDLLRDLRDQLGLGILLISHDLAVVAGTCDRMAVMYGGEIVESGSVRELFERPLHPYTRALLAALPQLGRPAPRGAALAIPGQVPAAAALPPGCPFHPRCAERLAACAAERPAWLDLGQRGVRCLARQRDSPEPR